MRRLILSAALPALMLGACSTMPGAQDPTEASVPVSQASMPTFPADLTPAGVVAADDHLALEAVDGAEGMAFVARSNERALATLEGDPRYEPFRQQAEAILTATDRIPAPSFLGEGIGIDELAAKAGTIGYEVLTALGARHLRRYVGE